MTDDPQSALRSYLAAQSVKVPAAVLAERLAAEGRAFAAALDGLAEAAAHTRPAAGEWSVVEIVDHVAGTLADVLLLMRSLAAGARPGRPMQVAHAPREPGAPLAAQRERLARIHADALAFLRGLTHEPHLEVRVADGDFGELNWKGYALILRLHYRDHTAQVTATRAALSV